jgi:putative tryptophan/tyrosine transport system substrate-binding protein
MRAHRLALGYHGGDVKRRELLFLIGATMAWPAVGLAQSNKVARIGVLVLGNPDPEPFVKELREGLRELGYIDGQNIQFELRSAKGKPGDLPVAAAELVALKVDIIVTFQTPAGIAAKNATTEIPIVLGSAGDPVGTGLVASYARPGGNITGAAGAGPEVGAKALELVREVLPGVRRVAMLANATDPFHVPLVKSIQDAGKSLGIDIVPMLVRRPDELDGAFAEVRKARAGAVVVQPSLPLKKTADLALKQRLPAFSTNASFPAAGGLMSYSADQPTLYRSSATFVDKILKGRKPADLPVELASKFLLVVNLRTARALGVTLPATMLTRANEVIE